MKSAKMGSTRLSSGRGKFSLSSNMKFPPGRREKKSSRYLHIPFLSIMHSCDGIFATTALPGHALNASSMVMSPPDRLE